jgi:F420-dependent oxidoreductase-like protein
VKIGLALGMFGWNGGPAGMADTVAEIARTADGAGFALIGVGDHLWQGPHAGGPEQPMLECFTTLGVIAAQTRHCLLMPLVAGVHYREPAVLAKMVTTLDVLSGGRAMLGIGAGWYEDEATGMGIEYPALSERYAMVEETIQICLQMWGDDQRPFHGSHYQLERPLNIPQSLTRPHPPIMIGGNGEQKTLRLVARYGDACNIFASPELPGKLDVLRQHCKDEGTDYDAIEKTCVFPIVVGDDGSDVPDLIDELRALAGAGVTTAIGIATGADPVRQVSILGDRVIPALADA